MSKWLHIIRIYVVVVAIKFNKNILDEYSVAVDKINKFDNDGYDVMDVW